MRLVGKLAVRVSTVSVGDWQRGACQPSDQRRHFIQAACGTCQGIKGLEATQREEDVHELVARRLRKRSQLVDESLGNDADPLPPPRIARPDHLLEIGIAVTDLTPIGEVYRAS